MDLKCPKNIITKWGLWRCRGPHKWLRFKTLWRHEDAWGDNMNAIQLFCSDGAPSKFWICGKCGGLRGGEPAATACCNPRCASCGASVAAGRRLCDYCEGVAWDAANLKRYEAAEKIPWREYGSDPVFYGGKFLSHLGELIEDEECDGPSPRPTWVNAASPFRFELALDGVEILERVFESDLGEEMRAEDLVGATEFAAKIADAVATFNAAQDGITPFHVEDPKRVVLLDDEFWTSYYVLAAPEENGDVPG
jgi:hypothetical protein